MKLFASKKTPDNHTRPKRFWSTMKDKTNLLHIASCLAVSCNQRTDNTVSFDPLVTRSASDLSAAIALANCGDRKGVVIGNKHVIFEEDEYGYTGYAEYNSTPFRVRLYYVEFVPPKSYQDSYCNGIRNHDGYEKSRMAWASTSFQFKVTDLLIGYDQAHEAGIDRMASLPFCCPASQTTIGNKGVKKQ